MEISEYDSLEVCPKCDGLGKIFYQDEDDDYQLYFSPESYCCDLCGGGGFVKWIEELLFNSMEKN